jgi:glycosyltransferase involved in cell wall biosynthesis
MPVKNAGKYLKPCLNSILAQSYKDWELIAINDASTDGSDIVLSDYAAVYINIHTADSEGIGIVNALQRAYGICSGNVIHRMDADDLMPVNKLEQMVSAVEMGTVVTGKVSYFCDDQKVGNGFEKYTAWLNGLMESGDFWRDTYRECPIPSSAWMMYRDDFERIGRFDSAFMPEDYDLAFRIWKNGLKVTRLNKVVHHWRDSATRTSRNESQYFPLAYLPLKVHYFIALERNKKPLVLCGAGKKGKLVAKELLAKGEYFIWVTNNRNKIGRDIYGVVIQSEGGVDYKNTQTILAISSPDEQVVLQKELDERNLQNNEGYFWFF